MSWYVLLLLASPVRSLCTELSWQMHSGTKYLGGHSDLLAGVLVTRSQAVWNTLFDDRIQQGAVPGNLEAWLILRSLRTLPLRVGRQASTARALASWLHSLTPGGSAGLQPADEDIGRGKAVDWVWHASLQPWSVAQTPFGRPLESVGFDPRSQMAGGFSPCFSIHVPNRHVADNLSHTTRYFIPATSLGGVESLLEQRITTNPHEDPGLIRVSTGLENIDDLIADLRSAFRSLLS